MLHIKHTLTALSLAVLACGCATDAPFKSLSAARQQSARISPCRNFDTQVKLNTIGAREARNLGAMGGLIGVTVGHSVAAGIENNNPALNTIRTATGEFEKSLIEEKFRTRLSPETLSASSSTNSQLKICIKSIGLREVERNQFVPSAMAVAMLYSPTGQETWRATARSNGSNPRALDAFEKQPDFYRKDFDEVADDLARQLVEGPVREIKD
jgi:hypothetical protein